ncbi:MAG TPA: ABC transporter permease [Gemmatimonadales bacterium]|nr:ABC transporter permease [Gemmatimonadales bacterium]
METWWQDLRHGARTLPKATGFASVAVLSLAIGIGANSAIFSITDTLLLKPLRYHSADRIAIVWQRSPGLNVAQDWLSIGQYLDIKNDAHGFDEVAAAIGASVNLTGGDAPERLDGARVSSSFFPLFGATAALGRVLDPDDDRVGQPPVVVLSDGFWRRRFGADPTVVGRTLSLNGLPFTVIGVLPATFRFDREVLPAVNGIRNVEFFLPLPLGDSARNARDREDYNVYARLRPGASWTGVEAELRSLANRMKRDYPANYPANGGLTLSAVPLLSQVVGDAPFALRLLLGAVGFVLLIACANVANLLLSRGTSRQKELAIRAAIGAGPHRLVRQLMLESVLLALLGGGVGLLLAVASIEALRRFGPASVPRLGEVGIDLRVVGFTFAASLLTAVVFGLLPAVRASRVDPNEALKEGGRSGGSAGQGPARDRLRRALISAEVALSIVLLLGAGLMVRSYQRILAANPGFNPHHLLTFRLSLPGFRYRTPEAVTAFYRTLEERIQGLPGVQAVGSNYLLPLSPVALGWEPISIEGYVPKAQGEDLIITSSGYVSQGYFRAMEIPLLKGRVFSAQDTRDAPLVAVVNDQLAARFWPGQDPLGKRLRRGNDGPWLTVVGVVHEEKEYAFDREPPIKTYFPVEQLPVATRYLVIRSSLPSALITAWVTREVRLLDPDLPLFDVSTMDERVKESLALRHLTLVLLGGFAAVALLLAAIGIYGITGYWASQRTHEIGIRMALGAEMHAIQRLVVWQAAGPVTLGLVVGLGAAAALVLVLKSYLFGLNAADGLSFALMPVVLGAVAGLASYLPARRAGAVDPLVALRQE